MSASRILLLVFMALVVFLMVSCPGLYDSKRSFDAHRSYFSARRQHESAPSAEAQRTLEDAKRGVDEAKRLDRKDIMAFEFVMLGILGLSIHAFIRAGRRIKAVSAA